MKYVRLSKRAGVPGMLGAMAAMLFAVGCASTATPPRPPDESLLAAAGFKVLEATTPEQQQRLQSLPPGKMRAVQRNGMHFFVYPDAAANRIYVGTQKEYQAYLQLRPGQVNLQDQLNAQQAADMAAYVKQDDAMQKANQRDLSDPYLGWPSFDYLVW
jgi:hypothetical protein